MDGSVILGVRRRLIRVSQIVNHDYYSEVVTLWPSAEHMIVARNLTHTHIALFNRSRPEQISTTLIITGKVATVAQWTQVVKLICIVDSDQGYLFCEHKVVCIYLRNIAIVYKYFGRIIAHPQTVRKQMIIIFRFLGSIGLLV